MEQLWSVLEIHNFIHSKLFLNFKSCDVMMSISTRGRVQFWIFLLNRLLFGQETWPTKNRLPFSEKIRAGWKSRQISIHTCTVYAWLCNLRKLSSKNWLRKKVENFQLPGNFFCWKLKNQSNFALISTNYFQYGWHKQLLEIFTGLCGEVIINFIT